MAIPYTVVSKRPAGVSGQNEPKYYPAISGRKMVGFRKISEEISRRSTCHPADVMAVLESFIDLLPELLLDGCSVKLGELGIFSVHASVTGRESPEQVSTADIKSLKMCFLPSKHIKTELKKAKFWKMKK